MAATLTLSAIAQPLRIDGDGVVRVGNTRVTLDTVVAAFHEGASPEGIISHFPTLTLADVYAAISFYLQNRTSVDAYLEEREREAEALRREIESTSPQTGLRERLLARRAQAQAQQT